MIALYIIGYFIVGFAVATIYRLVARKIERQKYVIVQKDEIDIAFDEAIYAFSFIGWPVFIVILLCLVSIDGASKLSNIIVKWILKEN